MLRIMTKEEYLKSPCKASSLPFWKTNSVAVPAHMLVLRDDALTPEILHMYTDEPYFKLFHSLRHIEPQWVPIGFRLVEIEIVDYARHIQACYEQEGVSVEELRAYQDRPTYAPELWLALADEQTGQLAATGIAELDREIGEGILEWIQVSADFRRRGLGRYIVNELLYRMKGNADFVTVSGKISNQTKPESLYKKCGFDGKVVWHILTKI